MKNLGLRILTIAPTPFFADRGCHVHIAEQAKALTRKGHDVLLVTYGSGRDIDGIRTVRTWRTPWFSPLTIGPSWHKFYLDIFLLWTSIRSAWKHQPDVIHGHLHEGAVIGWIVGKLFGIPLIFDCQGSLTGELLAHNFLLAKPKALRAMWYSLERWIDHRADRILAQSTTMFTELTERFGISPQKITMAFDGVNTDIFTPGKASPSLRTKLQIPNDANVVIFLGLLTPYQGVDDLIDSLPAVLEKVPDTFLVIMGYPNIESYKRRAEKLGVLHAIRFTGPVVYEDVPTYLHLGDVAVSPKRSQTEANGKIYNFMACGLPTVALDTGINRDILGDLGMYVSKPGDTEELSNAIINLLTHPALRQKLAQETRKRAVEHYSWDAVGKRIEEAYHAVRIPWQTKVFNVSIRKKEKWHWIKPWLKRYARPTSTCLDVGAGVGTLSVLQEKIGGNWKFTETDESAAKECEQIMNQPVLRISLADKTLEPSTYDIITAFDVIEHVANPLSFLTRMRELLRKDGVALLTTPAAKDGLYSLRKIAVTFFGIDNDAHGHVVEGFSRKELQTLAERAGFTVVSITPFSKFWTELVELAYNGTYILKNRKKQRTQGYNLSLSPASGKDIERHRIQLLLLRAVHPFLRGISLLDRVMPRSHGYGYGMVFKK